MKILINADLEMDETPGEFTIEDDDNDNFVTLGIDGKYCDVSLDDLHAAVTAFAEKRRTRLMNDMMRE